MPNYKELYFKLFRASEQAINLLIAAQLECEEQYIRQPEPEWKLLPISPDTAEDADAPKP